MKELKEKLNHLYTEILEMEKCLDLERHCL